MGIPHLYKSVLFSMMQQSLFHTFHQASEWFLPAPWRGKPFGPFTSSIQGAKSLALHAKTQDIITRLFRLPYAVQPWG